MQASELYWIVLQLLLPPLRRGPAVARDLVPVLVLPRHLLRQLPLPEAAVLGTGREVVVGARLAPRRTLTRVHGALRTR